MYVESFPRSEERLNAASHCFGAVLAVIGLVFLILDANDGGRDGSLPAAIVYGTAMVFLFLFSALHHALINPGIKQILLALDHCGIYLLIAGTYTPFSLLMPAGQAWELLAIIWGLAFIGMAVQGVAFLTGRSEPYERFAFLFYLAMGWIPVLWASGDLFGALQAGGIALLVAGGLAFSVGVVFYLWKSLPYGHAVWHLFVVAGAACHYFSIFYYVIGVEVG
ncbi:hemolysin III family protein [Magnetospira sp. QH-2]|uniref:PAQR family membrane homeostasis protein TrhA n=1 Tax=Magnetospira sp. (strain QH-2) TaxID=1288970 RepID=UPI0003E811BF|nr:hemolysin III family protein [Magnetospira sp. QH-2]CCQ73559.1 Hemolysin-3 [Magnetospira sp. QH-2]